MATFSRETFKVSCYLHHPVSGTGICSRFLRVTRILINSLRKACIWRHVSLALLNPDCFYLWAYIKQRFAAWNLKFPSPFISPRLCLGWPICYISELSSHFLLGDIRSCWTSIFHITIIWLWPWEVTSSRGRRVIQAGANGVSSIIIQLVHHAMGWTWEEKWRCDKTEFWSWFLGL